MHQTQKGCSEIGLIKPMQTCKWKKYAKLKSMLVQTNKIERNKKNNLAFTIDSILWFKVMHKVPMIFFQIWQICSMLKACYYIVRVNIGLYIALFFCYHWNVFFPTHTHIYTHLFRTFSWRARTFSSTTCIWQHVNE